VFCHLEVHMRVSFDESLIIPHQRTMQALQVLYHVATRPKPFIHKRLTDIRDFMQAFHVDSRMQAVDFQALRLFPSTDGGRRHQGQAFRRADHLVKRRVHEVQSATKLAAGEMAFPHLDGDALGGVPSVRAESGGTRKPVDPLASLRQGLNGSGCLCEGGVEGKRHGL
jgi:hypothetical protein